MSHDLYPSLDLPAITNEQAKQLKRGTAVQTRCFYGNSLPGNKATVLRHSEDQHGNVRLRCNYGKNRSGKSLLKWMPANVLCMG